MKPVNQISDRAKRYRAQKNKPSGPRRCNFCGNGENVDIDHIEGDEADGAPDNLLYLCRSCNTRKGITQARNRIGRRTRQFNPRGKPATFRQFTNHARVLLGLEPGDARTAAASIRATPPAKRREYGERIARANPFRSEAQRRKFYAMLERGEISRPTLEKFQRDNPAAPTFAQYAHGVATHQRGAHDEGGAIIHATPKALRHKYAMEIARIKRGRMGEVPF